MLSGLTSLHDPKFTNPLPFQFSAIAYENDSSEKEQSLEWSQSCVCHSRSSIAKVEEANG